jgi:hypothetical protein
VEREKRRKLVGNDSLSFLVARSTQTTIEDQFNLVFSMESVSNQILNM